MRRALGRKWSAPSRVLSAGGRCEGLTVGGARGHMWLTAGKLEMEDGVRDEVSVLGQMPALIYYCIAVAPLTSLASLAVANLPATRAEAEFAATTASTRPLDLPPGAAVPRTGTNTCSSPVASVVLLGCEVVGESVPPSRFGGRDNEEVRLRVPNHVKSPNTAGPMTSRTHLRARLLALSQVP